MPLEFPNPSRGFDEARNAVCFIGHDGMFKVPFFIEGDALAAPSRRGWKRRKPHAWRPSTRRGIPSTPEHENSTRLGGGLFPS
jgi:hypothetical protein